jgi:Integrase core domain
MPAPRSGYIARDAAISMRKPSWRWLPSFCASMVCQGRSPLTMIPAWSAALPDAISPPRLSRFHGSRGGDAQRDSATSARQNAYVERFHRSLGQECLEVHRPGTLWEVVSLTSAYLSHYNNERPNQARSCSNQPPRVASPAFPTLPAVAQTVDPDRWLAHVNKRAFARTSRARGDLTINRQNYSVSRTLAGRLHAGEMLLRSTSRSGCRGNSSSQSQSRACLERRCLSGSM